MSDQTPESGIPDLLNGLGLSEDSLLKGLTKNGYPTRNLTGFFINKQNGCKEGAIAELQIIEDDRNAGSSLARNLNLESVPDLNTWASNLLKELTTEA